MIISGELKQKCQTLIYDKKQDTATEKIVKFIEEENNIYTTKNDLKSEIWFYEEGIYKPNGISKIKEITREILEFMYTPQLVNKVISKIQADTYIEEKDFFNINYLKEIPVLNGVLNLETLKLNEFTPNKIFFNKLPVKYDKSKRCPNIDRFFEEVLKYSEDKKIAYEWFGYCLWKENFLEQAIMMYGNGSNGKGTFERLLKEFLGTENICSIPLGRLNPESFSVSELFGKLANIVGDIGDEGSRELKITETLRSIIARDPISAKRKFLNDLHFTNYSKQLFACNNLPIVRDNSIGFWRRWILLEFPYQFLSQEEINKKTSQEKEYCKIKDTDILKKLIEPNEMSGLLNKAIESLKKIKENKTFSYSKGSTEVKELWMRKSDSFLAFCIDNVVAEEKSIISKSELRREYAKYCKKHKLRAASDKVISITLTNSYLAISLYPGSYENITNEYAWEGIRLKNKTKEVIKEIKEL
jgi:putative DNA primase/helicase